MVYAHDLAGRPLYQVSGADLHVIYTVTYRITADQVFIVAINVADWSPQPVDMP